MWTTPLLPLLATFLAGETFTRATRLGPPFKWHQTFAPATARPWPRSKRRRNWPASGTWLSTSPTAEVNCPGSEWRTETTAAVAKKAAPRQTKEIWIARELSLGREMAFPCQTPDPAGCQWWTTKAVMPAWPLLLASHAVQSGTLIAAGIIHSFANCEEGFCV